MKALITPGQGRIPPEMLELDCQEKQYWRVAAESVLGKRITAENVAEHDVNSALILANALGAHDKYRSLGGNVDMVAGYSVGQYAALAMAGVLTPETALEIAIARARIMSRHASSGMRMLGVTGLSRHKIDGLITEVTGDIVQTDSRFLVVSNCNNAMNFTVAGSLDLLDVLSSRLENAGAIHCELLETEGAWHSRMLHGALDEFESLISRHDFMPPKTLFADNVTGRLENDPGVIKRNLVAHLVSPVRWEESVRSMIAAGADHFLECGAGKLLAKILFFIDRSKPCVPLCTNEEIARCAALPA